MSKNGAREDFTPDTTATRDMGGAYGGTAGTMPGAATEPVQSGTAHRLKRTGTDLHEQATMGRRPDTSSDPSAGISVRTGDAPAYRASDDQGGDHPMSRTDAGDAPTTQTDHRETAQNPDDGPRNSGTGDSAPEKVFREDPPTRSSGSGDTAANDAF